MKITVSSKAVALTNLEDRSLVCTTLLGHAKPHAKVSAWRSSSERELRPFSWLLK